MSDMSRNAQPRSDTGTHLAGDEDDITSDSCS